MPCSGAGYLTVDHINFTVKLGKVFDHPRQKGKRL
jgi:hypothetical protein